MELEELRLRVTEDDINLIASRLLTKVDQVRNVQIQVLSGRLVIAGTYQAFIAVPFETSWLISISNGKIAARLETLKAGRLNAGLVKNYLLQIIAAKGEGILNLEGETLLLGPDWLLRRIGLSLQTNLTAVHCTPAAIIFESHKPSQTENKVGEVNL